MVLPFLDAAQRELIDGELAFQQQLAARRRMPACRAAPIHADLFRDNVMFEATPDGDRLGGFFDFYFAGVDALLFDIAVCLNDWCIDVDTRTARRGARGQAFVAAYDAVRPLTGAEVRLLPALMRARGAALLDLAAVGSAPAARRRAC